MANLMRQPFTPGGKFVASRDFKFHSKAYAKGDEFPWRQLSCSVRKLRQLYEGRYLNNVYVDPDTMEVPEEAPAVVEEVIEEEVLEESNETDLIYDPNLHEIQNPSRGVWTMADAEGEHLLTLKAKEAKRLRKKMEVTAIDMDAVLED